MKHDHWITGTLIQVMHLHTVSAHEMGSKPVEMLKWRNINWFTVFHSFPIPEQRFFFKAISG
jgi:hypothetical protein